jgi:hypothetical protein
MRYLYCDKLFENGWSTQLEIRAFLALWIAATASECLFCDQYSLTASTELSSTVTFVLTLTTLISSA